MGTGQRWGVEHQDLVSRHVAVLIKAEMENLHTTQLVGALQSELIADLKRDAVAMVLALIRRARSTAVTRGSAQTRRCLAIEFCAAPQLISVCCVYTSNGP
jgi:hypothetical protein